MEPYADGGACAARFAPRSEGGSHVIGTGCHHLVPKVPTGLEQTFVVPDQDAAAASHAVARLSGPNDDFGMYAAAPHSAAFVAYSAGS